MYWVGGSVGIDIPNIENESRLAAAFKACPHRKSMSEHILI